MGRYALEVRYGVLLARAALAAGHAEQAWTILSTLPADADGRSVDPELRAQVHYWRAEALRRRGDPAAARAEHAQARALIDRLRQTLPERYRATFTTRPDIRQLS
jgi:hypothetical protein